MNRGQLIVVSGPSGVGKGTVLQQYLAGRQNVAYSVSATTRAPRPGEEDGVHYFFLSKEQFEQTAQSGGMLEYACYNGNYYGTPKAAVERERQQGNDVILEIEVQGALQVKKSCPDALLIFIAPPSFEQLAQRLRGRQTEDEQTVNNRLAIARGELAQAQQYDYIVVNDTVEQAVEDYRKVQARIKANPMSADHAEAELHRLERFFRSQWFEALTDADGRLILSRLKKEAA